MAMKEWNSKWKSLGDYIGFRVYIGLYRVDRGDIYIYRLYMEYVGVREGL